MAQQELVKQLKLMKAQIDAELAQDLKKMRDSILDELKSYIDAAVSGRSLPASAAIDDLKDDIKELKADMAAASKLQVARPASSDLALITKQVSSKISGEVYAKVIADVNKNIMPKVNQAVKLVNYRTEDTTELLDNYRREIENNYEGDSRKLITDGRKDDKQIRSHVNMAWGEEY